MKETGLICLLLALASPLPAKDLEVEILAYPQEVPFGITQIPILAEVRSSRPLTMWELSSFVAVVDSQGEKLPHCPERSSNGDEWRMVFWSPAKRQAVPAGWSYQWLTGIWCNDFHSELTVQLFLKGGAPPNAKPIDKNHPLWQGEVHSEPVHTTFVEPTGIDKEAFEALKGNPMGSIGKLLVDYPTSTYAAYFLRASECNNRYSLPIVEIMRSRNGAYTRTEAMIDPVTGAQKLFRGDDVGNLCNKWLAAALEAHPDIWFADKLRLGLAINAVWLGEDDAAAAQFAELALKSDLDVIREAATKNLASMVAYHITKPEAIPEKLRAKLPKVELRTRTPAAKK